jgi:hypothetical protein
MTENRSAPAEGHRWVFSQHVSDVPPEQWGAKLAAR